MDELKKDYLEAILDTDKDRAMTVVENALEKGMAAESIMFDVVIPVMGELADIVGTSKDATLAQLYLASQIADDVTDRLVGKFKATPGVEGHVVLGCSAGDFHGLGKKILSGCLRANLVDITDLGLNVAPEKFVETAVRKHAQVIGVSSMMVHTARGDSGPRRIRELLSERGLEGKIRLVVGGAPYRFHPSLFREVGADAWADNGLTGASVIAGLIEEVQG